MNAVIRTMFLILIVAPAFAGAVPSSVLPILGVDPMPQGTIVENHQDALPHWVEAGLTGAVLLHISADSGLRNVAPERMEALKGLSSRRDLAGLHRTGRSGEGRLYDAGSFVRVAAGLGIVREVVWITPLPLMDTEDAAKHLKDYVGRAGLSAEDAETFRPESGCLQGRVGGIPVSLCSQERLPVIRDPVLLSIDASYLLSAASARGIAFTTESRSLFTTLRAARYSAMDTVFAYSGQEGELPPDLRWVGEMVCYTLQNPAVILTDNPPERWAALQALSTFGAGGRQREMEMLGFAIAQLEKQPHDPAFLLYAAEATDRHGGGERALAYAEEACRMDRGYCVGLREVGLRFIERGDVEAGLSFFAAGERLLPGMEYGQFELGIALMKAGRPAEAQEALEKERGKNGAFPSGFLIGVTQLYRGDRAAARVSFDAALAAIERLTDLRVARPEIAQVIATAAAFYREEGLEQRARQLENDPRLRLPAPPPESGRE